MVGERVNKVSKLALSAEPLVTAFPRYYASVAQGVRIRDGVRRVRASTKPTFVSRITRQDQLMRVIKINSTYSRVYQRIATL